MSNTKDAKVVCLDGGTEVIVHEDGRVYLTGYGMPATGTRDLPRIFLTNKDARYMSLEILKHTEELNV